MVSSAGKPELVGAGPFVSWSYSGPYVLVGASSEHPIGVDIERSVLLPDAPQLIQRFFSGDEPASGDSSDSVRFLTWWTQVEAATKAAGLRLVDVLDESLTRSIDRSLVVSVGSGSAVLGAIAGDGAFPLSSVGSAALRAPSSTTC